MHHDNRNRPILDTILGRRAFLRGARDMALTGLCAGSARAQAPAREGTGPQAQGLILREKEPENLEFPFCTLDSFLTPVPRFYIRNHFAAPKLDPRSWRLKVEGAVHQPLELSFEDLLQLPARTKTALLECAGNSRVFLTPKAAGVQWELGAASNAEWTGVPLAAVLERAGVREGALEVTLEGADVGEIRDEPKSPGKIHFTHNLPLAKARQPEVLLAHRMNGAALPVAHGFPVRALVPGWYGMASVKWLTRIVVQDRPSPGYFESLQYSYFQRQQGVPTLVPVTELAVKAAIARPTFHEMVPAGKTYRMHGAAWTGESEVTKVQVSTDAGQTWTAARLLDKPVPHAWRFWEYEWRAPAAAGNVTLMARATDARGRVQPLQRDPSLRSYMISHVLPIDVEIR